MAKGYFVSCYRQISDPAKFAAYAKLAGPALEAGGGRFLARGTAAEFDSVERAIAAHDSPAYKEALAALEGGAVRDVRIVSGV
jgi:uncharacterized protein (DUF1330 family)